MIRTTLDQTTILFQVVNSSQIKETITGQIYKDARLPNSIKEDVVVNSITITGSDSLIQKGLANVNVHLPNLSNGLPNHLRFKELADILTPLLSDYVNNDHNFWIESSGLLIKDEAANQWYMNYRLRFQFHNTHI